MFGVLFAIFVVLICLNYMFLDIKVDKIKKESLNKDQVIDSLIAHNKALCKLNTGFKDHERRINDIEKLLLSEKPEEPKEPEYTCKDCTYYHALSGISFINAINFGFSNGINDFNGFKCEKIGCSYPSECNGTCQLFEKKDSLDEDENVVYANNVKIDISSKAPQVVYKVDGLLPEEYIDLISKLYYTD